VAWNLNGFIFPPSRHCRHEVNLAEWLRRQTRNLLGFPRAGSNPAVDVLRTFVVVFFGNWPQISPR
jgi:hypothetical protein